MKLLFSILGLSYVFCPYDLFPDFFVGVGWIDDLIVIGLLWYFYIYRKRRYGYSGHNQEAEQPFGGEGGRDTAEQKAPDEKDPYSVLGIRRGATAKEIKEAYRRLASRYHPDKVVHLGEEFRELAEFRFKEIQNAYQRLRTK